MFSLVAILLCEPPETLRVLSSETEIVLLKLLHPLPLFLLPFFPQTSSHERYKPSPELENDAHDVVGSGGEAAEQFRRRRRQRLLAESEVDGGWDGAAGEDAEGPVLEERRDGRGVVVDHQRVRSVSVFVQLVHVNASSS